MENDRMEIKSLFMTRMVSNVLSTVLSKKVGNPVSIEIGSFSAEHDGEEVFFKVNMKGAMKAEDFEKLIKEIM